MPNNTPEVQRPKTQKSPIMSARELLALTPEEMDELERQRRAYLDAR